MKMETTASQPSPPAPAQSFQVAQTPEGLYLQLGLDRSLPAMLPAPQLVEILTVAIGQVVPIFHLPPWVMGVYNWRGEVLWIVDLNHLLGLTPWYEQADYAPQHTVIVLRDTSQSKEKAIVGLVVNRAEEMVKCTADSLHLLPGLNSVSESASESVSEPVSAFSSDSSSAFPAEFSAEFSSGSPSDFSLDSSSDSGSASLIDELPAKLHQFIAGYWQNEIAPRHWLLDSAAILRCLSETFS